MSLPLIATKLYIPPPRSKAVLRPRLIQRLNQSLPQEQGFRAKLTLISAPAGFGKTTLVSEWIAVCPLPAAWLSLDEGDSDPTRFLAYLVAALQTVAPEVGAGVLAALQSPQPPSSEVLLTALINDIAALPHDLLLVLDDYHVIETKPVTSSTSIAGATSMDAATSIDGALTFLLAHLPPQLHLVIATREDPQLPLARWRARGQLTELRAADLRFTPAEAAQFLNEGMGLTLSAAEIAALEARTGGWIAGLQFAALALQGAAPAAPGAASLIQSFSGSHHFVLDYLLEEVLHQQPEPIQAFLLRTAILDRLCGPLCDAVLNAAAGSGQRTLEYLERANLFIVSLDNERRWYRYHRLFADLLRQRLQQQARHSASSPAEAERWDEAELHIRASAWYEAQGLEIEAFQHAAAAQDVARAERLVKKRGFPLHFRGAVTAVLHWLASLPEAVLDARPTLWVRRATLSLVAGQTRGVEEYLQAAETALQRTEPAAKMPEEETRNLLGEIAAARATLAVTIYQAETILVQSRRALEYLPPDNLTFRFTAVWTLAFAHELQGDRAAAGQAYTEALSISQASGDAFSMILAANGLGQMQEYENQLYPAAKNYQTVLQLAGDQPQPNACEALLGLARICYQWNDLPAAEQHGQQSLQLAQQYDSAIDRYVTNEVFLARLKLARGDAAGAAAMLAQTEQTARQHNFVLRMPEIAAAQVPVLLQQGKLAAAAQLAQAYDLPLSRARVQLAQGSPSAALAVLAAWRQQVEARHWADERLQVLVLQAVALLAKGDQAVPTLAEALALAEPGGFLRIFLDEGRPMLQLLSAAAAQGILPGYTGLLLAAFEREAHEREAKRKSPIDQPGQPLIEPLSPRELEVLRLIAQGLSNQAIGERLFLAVDTVKGHNRRIFEKLQVQQRTAAVARARALGLLEK